MQVRMLENSQIMKGKFEFSGYLKTEIVKYATAYSKISNLELKILCPKLVWCDIFELLHSINIEKFINDVLAEINSEQKCFLLVSNFTESENTEEHDALPKWCLTFSCSHMINHEETGINHVEDIRFSRFLLKKK